MALSNVELVHTTVKVERKKENGADKAQNSKVFPYCTDNFDVYFFHNNFGEITEQSQLRQNLLLTKLFNIHAFFILK